MEALDQIVQTATCEGVVLVWVQSHVWVQSISIKPYLHGCMIYLLENKEWYVDHSKCFNMGVEQVASRSLTS